MSVVSYDFDYHRDLEPVYMQAGSPLGRVVRVGG